MLLFKPSLILLFYLLVQLAFGQSPQFHVLQNGLSSMDSSYYDICRVADDDFWAIGKGGIITQINSAGIRQNVRYPNQGADLLSMTILDENNYLLCADKGFVYQYNKKLQIWKITQLTGYENSCFYSVCAVNEKIAFISGGRSEIVNSRKVIPFGFIIKTEDGGNTWKQVYKSVISMFWSVKYDKESNCVFAIEYTPVKTKLIFSDDVGSSWQVKEKKIKGLYHDFIFSEGKLVLAGGKSGSYRKNGILRSGSSVLQYPETGLFWDVEINENITIASGTHGTILCKNNSDEWHLFQTPVSGNLYEICFIDATSAFLVGNQKTILKISW